MSLNNLTNVIRKSTRITRNSSTLLAPIIVSDQINVIQADTLDVDSSSSDRKATTVLLKFVILPSSSSKRKVWYYDRADFFRLNRLIDSENWNFIDILDVNDACDRFTNKLIDMMSQCIPSKEVTIRPNAKPWYDSVIRRLSRKRDRQKKIVTKRGLLTDWEKYKFLRNKVNNLKRFAKQRYFSHLDECLSDSHVDNPQKYWKYLRSLVNANKKSDQVPILKSFENDVEVLHYTDEDKAECLNKYFSSISMIQTCFYQGLNGKLSQDLIILNFPVMK